MNAAGRWGVIGGIVAMSMLIVFYIIIPYSATPHYNETQKIEINKMIAENCTKCLKLNNHKTCTAENIEYSNWGVICNESKVSENGSIQYNYTYVHDCDRTCKQI